ncbi:MAG: HNH endonuclease signature motif containing protein [Thermodesulfobacteriota bacterium]
MRRSRRRDRASHKERFFAEVFGPTDEGLRAEKEKARELRKSRWWKEKLAQGKCHYCGQVFAPGDLTMDHVVPLSRGGKSVKENLMPSCKECNTRKKLDLLMEMAKNEENEDER